MRSIKILLALGIVAAVFTVAFKLVPVYLDYYRLQDGIESTTRLNMYSLKSEDEIRQGVWADVKNLELPIKAEDIQVRRNGQEVIIWTRYRVHVDLPVHPFDLDFHPAARNGQKIEPPGPQQ
jgi:Domain of unknown function (DUF4845)